jgi:hypothetical protein
MSLFLLIVSILWHAKSLLITERLGSGLVHGIVSHRNQVTQALSQIVIGSKTRGTRGL